MSKQSETLVALGKLRETIAGRIVDLEGEIARTKHRTLRQIKEQCLDIRREFLADIDSEISACQGEPGEGGEV